MITEATFAKFFEAQTEDLKQFIVVTIGQTEATMRKEFRSEIAILRAEMHEGFGNIADVFDAHVYPNLDRHEKRLDEHDQQIDQLRHQAAA